MTPRGRASVSKGIARSHVAWSVRALARTTWTIGASHVDAIGASHVDANPIARARTKVSRASADVSLVMRSTTHPLGAVLGGGR